MSGVMQSLIKISANFASENMYRDMYRGMAAAQKMGRNIGNSYQKGIDSSVKPIGGVGNITATQHKLLQKNVQKRLADNLQEIDTIINKSLLQSFGSGKQNRTNSALSKLAQTAALNNYSLKEFISTPGMMKNTMGRTAALDVLRVLDKGTFTGYDSIISNSVKEMREMNRFGIQQKIADSFKNPNGYRPSRATVGGIKAGNPLFNRSAGYALGGFMGSPAGMALSMGALGIYTGSQGVKNVADLDKKYRQTAAYLGGTDPLGTFNNLLKDPLESAALQYATSIDELNSYVMEAIKSGFSPDNIASSLNNVAGLKRTYALSVPAITELIVMAANQNWVDPADPESINKYTAKLITMVSNTKGSLGDFSASLGYAQTLLNAPGMTDTDFMTIMGVMSDSNIKGTRGGRATSHFLQRLLVPDSKADDINKNILNALNQEGINNVKAEDIDSLSKHFASIGWSIYNKKGEIKIGEGKQYANYTEAFVDLFKTIEDKKMTDAQFQEFGGEFGQIAQRVFSHLAANFGSLTVLRSKLVEAETNQKAINAASLNTSLTGIGFTVDAFGSAMGDITAAVLASENALGGLSAVINPLTASLEALANSIRWATDMIQQDKGQKNNVLMAKAMIQVEKDSNLTYANALPAQRELMIKTAEAIVAEYENANPIVKWTKDRLGGKEHNISSMVMEDGLIKYGGLIDYNPPKFTPYELHDMKLLNKKNNIDYMQYMHDSSYVPNYTPFSPSIPSLAPLGYNIHNEASMKALGLTPVKVELNVTNNSTHADLEFTANENTNTKPTNPFTTQGG